MNRIIETVHLGNDVLLLEVIDMPGLTWCWCGPATGHFKEKPHYSAKYHHRTKRWSWSRTGSATEGRWSLPEHKAKILRQLEKHLKTVGIDLPGK